MKRKLTSAIALSIAITNIMPIIVNAQPVVVEKEAKTIKADLNNNVLQKYPKLKVIRTETIVKQKFSEDIYNKLDNIINELNVAVNTKDMSKLEKAIADFLEIHIIMEYDDIVLHSENDQLDYIVFNSISLLFELTEGKESLRNEKLSKLIDDLYVSSVKKFNKLHYGIFLSRYAQYMNTIVSSYLNDDRTKEIILYGFCMINSIENWKGLPSNPDEDGNDNSGFPIFPEEEKPSIVKPDVVPPPPVIPPEEEIPPIKPPIKPPTGDGEYLDNDDYEEFEYIYRNGSCYKIIRIYNGDGFLKKTIEEKLNSGENSFCGIYDDPVIDIDYWNKNNKSDISTQVWDSLAENDLNQLSNNTIQFTINKTDEKPYYYDTGIRASAEDTVTFTQLKDTFLQIITKTKGYVLEDKEKIMFISEGKPLIIIDKNREYTAEEVSTLLKDFKEVGLKIDEKKSLDGESLEDRFNNNELNTITFNGEKTTLKNSPQLKDGILLLPVSEIAELVKLKTENTSDKLILTGNKDGKDIKIEIVKNTKTVIINSTIKTTISIPKITNGTMFAEMNLIVKEAGYNLIFNAESGTIEIK